MDDFSKYNDWDKYRNDDRFQFDYYPDNGEKQEPQANPSKPNKNKLMILILSILVVVFVVGFIFIYSQPSNKDDRYQEYQNAQSINEVLGIDNALEVETTIDDSTNSPIDVKVVQLTVKNNTDYYINQLVARIYAANTMENIEISLKPHDKACFKVFTVNSENTEEYKNLELKAINNNSRNISWISEQPKDQVIYADEIQVNVTNVSNNEIKFSITNNSNYDCEIDSYKLDLLYGNDEIKYYDMAPDVRKIGSKDRIESFNIAKHETRKLLIVDRDGFDQSYEYSVFVEPPGAREIVKPTYY